MNSFHSVCYTAFLCAGHLGVSGVGNREEEIQERKLREKLEELKQLVKDFETLDEKLTKLERTVRGQMGD